MIKHLWKWLFATLLIVILVIFGFTFTVREGSGVIVSRFGEIRRVCTEAGLYFKFPFPIDNTIVLDLRAQVMDSGYTETLTHDKRNIILQTHMVWNIENPALFYTSIGSMDTATKYLNDLLANSKNGVMGSYDLSNLVSTNEEDIKLANIESDILFAVKEKASANYGVNVQTVKVKRLSLPYTNVETVFEQMSTDRQKYVTQLIAEGERDASIIRSSADAEAAEIIANGQREAAAIQADTERQVSEIYAEAYSKNPELFTMLQQLSALEGYASDKTTLVMESSESPFSVLISQPEADTP